MATWASIKDGINAAFRDYGTAGVPASGAHDPVKQEIRAALLQAVIAMENGEFDEPPDFAADLAEVLSKLEDLDAAIAAGVNEIVATEVQPLIDEAAASAAAAAASADDAADSAVAVPTLVNLAVDRLAGSLPPTPIVELNLFDADADPIRYVENRQTAIPIDDQNLIVGAEAFAGNWVPTGVTASNNRTDSDGGKMATRLAGAAASNIRYGSILAGGTFTISFRAKSNTGSPHDIEVGGLFDTKTTKTIGTSWGSVSQAVTSGNFYPYIGAPAGTAMDIDIEDFRVDTGSAETAIGPGGHLYFGDGAGTPAQRPAKGTAKSWVNTGGVRGTISLPAPLGSNDFTILACVKQTASAGGYGGIIASPTFTDLSLTLQTGMLTGFHNTATAARHSVDLYGLGWVLVGLRNDGAREEQSLIFGDIDFQFDPSTGSEKFVQNFVAGALQTGGGYLFPGQIGDISFYDRALSNTELRQIFETMKGKMRVGEIELMDPNRLWIAEGDSRFGYANTSVDILTPDLLDAGILPVKTAYQGDGIKHLYERAERLDAMVKPGRQTYITLLIGANDLVGYGSASLYWSDLQRWLERRYQAGHNRIDVCTSLPSSISGFNAARGALDTLIRAGEGIYFNRVIDLAASSMGSDANGADPAKYYDGTHPTPAGHAILAGIFEPYILAAFRGRDVPMSGGGVVSPVHPPIEP